MHTLQYQLAFKQQVPVSLRFGTKRATCTSRAPRTGLTVSSSSAERNVNPTLGHHRAAAISQRSRAKSWSISAADGDQSSKLSTSDASEVSSLCEGDIVAVVGAGGNVGRLVALRLADAGKYAVRATTRNQSKLGDFLGNKKVELFAANTREPETLKEVLTGANCVIVCTGVTAFKTKAWDGGNTPDAVDNLGVKNVVDTWASVNPDSDLKRFVLMSSICVTRRTQFPYIILNGGGVLDAKQKGEDAVTAAAREHGFEYSIVRPGQLTGGPYTNNNYLGTLFQIDKSQKQKVVLQRGDKIVGDTVRSTLAEVLAQSIESPGTANLDFVVVNENGSAPTTEELQDMFLKVPKSGNDDDVQMPRLELVAETVSQAIENLFSGNLFKKDK